jgi:hypothetical protein
MSALKKDRDHRAGLVPGYNDMHRVPFAAVLRRSAKRPSLRTRERILLAAASRLLPRER